MSEDKLQLNPDYVTPPDGTVVGMVVDRHGYRKLVMRNGKATLDQHPEGTCDGDGQDEDDE